MNNPWAINSPQAPDDLLPIPWQQRGLADIGANVKVIQSAADEGIYTLEDLDRLPDLSVLKGVGPATADKLRTALDAYK